MERVSIITPTHGREAFLPRVHEIVRRQRYPDIEWLILDDSPSPAIYFSSAAHDNVRYLHSPARMSVGEKRNRLIAEARGGIIAHFDDDDYYAPDYVATMVARLIGDVAMTKLDAFFLYHARARLLGYWNLGIRTGVHFRWSNGPIEATALTEDDAERLGDLRLGFGFSYVYRRAAWEAVRFPDVNWDEDGIFARTLDQRMRIAPFADEEGLALHIVHGANTSQCFPQFALPGFAVDKIFGPAAWDIIGISQP